MSEHNDIEELVQHLANLTFLLDFYEKTGSVRNKWIVAEFDAYNKELIAKLKEVYSDETRPSNKQPHGLDKAGTDFPRSQPRRR